MESSIPNRIRLFRTALGYSQEYVAKKLHITQQANSLIESNPEKATLERLKKLEELLRVDLFTLIGEDKSLVLNNINQKGGNAATQMVFHTEKDLNSLYENHMKELKNQIDFLKGLLSKEYR
ncbi:MAG: helix-turn-helix transcriptional regulator [Flavobacteriales bacterium]|nr:helix-turn-helix transcriptional regulator [Flavobacteriales bacterium]